VVAGTAGQQVYSLAGPQHAYRLLIEEMSEGALTLSPDGGVLYCNRRVATLLDQPLDQVLGRGLDRHVIEADRAAFFAMLSRAQLEGTRGELTFLTSGGIAVTTLASFGTVMLEGTPLICLVLTDLREQKRPRARSGCSSRTSSAPTTSSRSRTARSARRTGSRACSWRTCRTSCARR
jgi:PAS domain-containing protein